jgi:two-component system, cell cycle response regulator
MGEQPGAVVAPMTPSTDPPPRVLISDPDPAGRSRVCAILRANGIPAETAETAEEVLAATEADTVLLSLDGSTEEPLELIREIRGLEPHRPAVVVMSGQGQALLPRALVAGADDYLITPARPEELMARLRVVADRRRLEAEQVMARTDPLTGLLNDGAFRERLGEEVKRSARYGRSLSLALLEIDHFKLVNERHGRRAGDRTLRAVAELAGFHARETDVVGRVGGAELAWLMPETDLAGAEQAAERLRSFIAATPTCGGRVTASIGLAELAAGVPPGDLFSSADAAMCRAKEAGRNRVVASRSAPSVD